MVSMLPTVKEYMREEVYFIDGEDTLSKAVGIFREKGLPIIVVLANSKNYLGIITDRIILRSTLNLDVIKAKNVALKIPLLNIDDTVAKAARLMLENTVKGLPVSSENKKIIGIITVDDIGRAAGERLYAKMKVKEVMTRDPITITVDSTIGKALVLMRDNGISRLPVVRGNKLVGLVTIRDIIDKVLMLKSRATRGEVSGEKIRSLGYKVSNIMTKHVVQSSPEEDLTKAIKKMIDHDVSCLVITHSNRVEGILTWTDILEIVASLEEKEKPPINIQVSYKVKDASPSEKSEIIKVAERYISKLSDALGNGNLLLHFKEHKEKHGEEHLIHCRARLRTDKVDLVGVGEAWTLSQAARVALDKIERQLLTIKELAGRYPYTEEVFRSIVGEL
ncbi:MAG: CBS domain-containing protein [Aigarchaeota archaeon]|nr:CBS domain-containing protein [Aigarchaeota archaeon]